MARQFKSYDEQIEILINRGLEISNKKKAKYILADLNYFNLIDGYKKPFLKKIASGHKERYKDGAKFEEIFYLHELDWELKGVLFPHLLRFEKLLKNSCAYHFSSKHPGDYYPYLEVDNYSTEKNDLSTVLRNISTLSNIISRETKYANNNEAIHHYIDKHKYIPLWVLINQLTLGNVSCFYSSLDESLQNEIARDFGEKYKRNYKSKEKLSSSELKEIIKICNYFRNICAHDEVMYSFSLEKTGQVAIFQKFFKDKYTGKNFHDLLLVLKLVLEKSYYDSLINQVKEVKEKYRNKFKSITIDYIFALAGF